MDEVRAKIILAKYVDPFIAGEGTFEEFKTLVEMDIGKVHESFANCDKGNSLDDITITIGDYDDDGRNYKTVINLDTGETEKQETNTEDYEFVQTEKYTDLQGSRFESLEYLMPAAREEIAEAWEEVHGW